jgi:hypothetical protein
MRRTLALAALLLLAAAPAPAQTRDTAWIGLALENVCPGGRVRLFLHDGERAEGRCGPVTDGRLLVRDSTAAEHGIPLEDVRQVWVRERQFSRGATLGATRGAVVMALVSVFLLHSSCESSDCSGDYGSAMALGALVGLGGGFVIGGAVGALETEWERRYP